MTKMPISDTWLARIQASIGVHSGIRRDGRLDVARALRCVFALALLGSGLLFLVLAGRRDALLGHGLVLRVRNSPAMTRPALAACDQTAPQADAPLMSSNVRSSRVRCASGMSSMSLAHSASML